jgi:hypothetical protein
MRILFAPFSIAGGLIAGFLAKKAFDLIWGRVSDEEAPRPEEREVGWGRLALALVFEGAIFRLVKGITDRGSRKGFERATGTWPGDERPDPA